MKPTDLTVDDPIVKDALRVWMGIDTRPRSYNEMARITDLVYRYCQLHEISPRDLSTLMKAASARP